MAIGDRLLLGFDNYSIRDWGWKAPQLLEYAVGLKVDLLLLSDLDVFDQRSEADLREFRARAEDAGIRIQVGTLSVCQGSVLFNPRRGSAEEQLRETIRVARSVGSPLARCVLGKVDDRRGPGGINARARELLEVLGRVRSEAVDSGVRIAVENHAGDLQARELAALIEEAGTDWVGALVDSGNAVWALEHPLANLEILAPYALTTGIRDSALWETNEGATLQWTALGEGQIDFQEYFRRFAELCPHVPVVLEIISGRAIPIPFWNDAFWEAYPNARTRDFVRFLALARRGTPRAPFTVPPGRDAKAAVQEYQKAELERSLRYAREVLGLGQRR